MAIILNLDINNNNKTTDYAVPVSSDSTIYFRVNDGEYVIDYTKVTGINIELETTNPRGIRNYRLGINDIVMLDEESIIRWVVPSSELTTEKQLKVTIDIRYNNRSYTINEFEITVGTDFGLEMSGILSVIDRFNYMVYLYLQSIKRSEIGSIDGIVPLNSNRKIENLYLPDFLKNHIPEKLYDTLYTIEGVHGLRINRTSFALEYFNSDTNTWTRVNRPIPRNTWEYAETRTWEELNEHTWQQVLDGDY